MCECGLHEKIIAHINFKSNISDTNFLRKKMVFFVDLWIGFKYNKCMRLRHSNHTNTTDTGERDHEKST